VVSGFSLHHDSEEAIRRGLDGVSVHLLEQIMRQDA
jgi:hypothetical protein